jgi:hypothetical protein
VHDVCAGVGWPHALECLARGAHKQGAIARHTEYPVMVKNSLAYGLLAHDPRPDSWAPVKTIGGHCAIDGSIAHVDPYNA